MEEEERFFRLLLQLSSYETILAVERQTWCGTAVMHLYALDDITCSRDETAKSHPFGSKVVLVEHLRNSEVRLCLSSICVTW